MCYSSRFAVRTLIITARIGDKGLRSCTMSKHLATDGSISVTNFICFSEFVRVTVMKL
jgi:hypothetical protein